MKLEASSLVLRPSIQRGSILSWAVSGRNTACAIRLWSVFNSKRERTLSRCVFEFSDKLVGLECFTVNFIEARDTVVPFQEGGSATDELRGAGIEFPDGIQDRMIVRIENV